MKEGRRNWLWDWMAFIYDEFYKRFPPYQKLHQEIIRYLRIYPSSPEFILDAGCGTGLLSVKLAQLGYPVLGIDRSSRMLKLAKNRTQKAGLKNLSFLEWDLNTKIHFEGGCFSRILFIHSFYLLENPGRTLQCLCSILHEEGEVILCNPSRRLSARELWAGGIFFLREVIREEGFSSFIIFLLIALGMGLLNGIIQRQKQKKVFSCWNEKEIENLLKSSGLKIKWLKKSCLGEGHLLVCAGKES